MQNIANRVETIRERITIAARRAGRDPAHVTLVAVTKTQPSDVIAQAIAAGLTNLGENRVQEAQQKIETLSHARQQVSWHLIGHLQRNKAKTAVQLVDVIHSLDSLRLAEKLNQHIQERMTATSSRFPVLLQVNVSGEASKEGLLLPGGVDNTGQLPQFLADVERILALPHLDVQGLMTVAPLSENPEAARSVFRHLRRVRDRLEQDIPGIHLPHLSMGMTDDFEVAIEEGATIIRVGRAIFGERGKLTP